MKIYKAIIWFSMLLIISEGLILTDFDFMSVDSNQGRVLGQSTDMVLEEVASRNYPASYYTTEVAIDSVLAQDSMNAEPDTEATESDNSTDVAESSAPVETLDDVGTMVQILNTPALGDPLTQTSTSNSIDKVRSLINKNKRFYLKSLQRELDEIREELGGLD